MTHAIHIGIAAITVIALVNLAIDLSRVPQRFRALRDEIIALAARADDRP